MEGLLTFLLFGGLFYFMMRFGCGAHVHGGHGAHGHAGGPHGEHVDAGDVVSAGWTDPVCGMEVAEGEGYARMQGGRAFRFCSRRCLDEFESNPGRYGALEGARP